MRGGKQAHAKQACCAGCAQTLSGATPLVDKSKPVSKITVTY